MTPEERLAEIAKLTNPCGEPGIADGFDTCGHGQVWPCSHTRIAWLAKGLNPDAEVRKVLDEARRAQDAEQAEWEALNEQDPEAARRYAMDRLGW